MVPPNRKVIANVDRLHRLMDAAGLDAVAVRTGVNFTYLAGIAMPGTLARHLDIASTVRGFMLIWPRKGEPIIAVDSFAETLVARDSWVGKIVVYKAYVESLYTRVANVLSDIGLANARVGFEKDGLAEKFWDEIQQALPRLEMLDCSRLMDEVRWIKTPAEVEWQTTL